MYSYMPVFYMCDVCNYIINFYNSLTSALLDAVYCIVNQST